MEKNEILEVFNKVLNNFSDKEINEDLSEQLKFFFIDKLEKTFNKIKEKKNIYKMNLHDIIYINKISIIRVPNGWLYDGVFVPYDREFNNFSNIDIR
jgi:hypothetical protein